MYHNVYMLPNRLLELRFLQPKCVSRDLINLDLRFHKHSSHDKIWKILQFLVRITF